MEGRAIVLLALALIACANSSLAQTEYYSKTSPYSSMKNQLTNLHFYFHDTLSGQNPSVALVAKPNTTGASKTQAVQFGSLFAIDDPLTVGPDPASEVIGRAQGLYVSSSQEELTLVMYVDFGFTSGEFNGSSISVVSRNPVTNTERELAVVGGRGKFRMAQGFAQLKTYSLNSSTGDAIVEYNVTVIH